MQTKAYGSPEKGQLQRYCSLSYLCKMLNIDPKIDRCRINAAYLLLSKILKTDPKRDSQRVQ